MAQWLKVKYTMNTVQGICCERFRVFGFHRPSQKRTILVQEANLVYLQSL